MGLTSSQGRLLMLTSRLSDIQLDEILISQRQNQLAWQSQAVAKTYQEKTTNMKLVMKVYDSSENTGMKTTDVTYTDMVSMGYIVTDSLKNIYLNQNEDGTWNVPKASSLPESKQNIFSTGVYYVDENSGEEFSEQNEEGTLKPKIKYNNQEYNVIKGNDVLVDKTKLQNNLMNGILFVLNTTGNDTFGSKVNDLESNRSFEWVYDTSDDAEAESEYNYATAEIARKDNELEMELKQLETQHNAILQEIESVEKVIDKNVERTFKLFDA